MKAFPEEWYLKRDKLGPARFGSGKVRIPRGTLYFTSGGSNSGYNGATVMRSGIGIKYETALPRGEGVGHLFRFYPKGSYIALPGETGVDHPEYKAPWTKSWSVKHDDYRDADTRLLLVDPVEGKGVSRWVNPTHHPKTDFVKEGSRRGAPEGTASITTFDPDKRYAIVRAGIGGEWKITTWKDAFDKRIEDATAVTWDAFSTWYKNEYGKEPPPLPPVEEVLNAPERPLKNGSILFFVYRTKDGALIGSPSGGGGSRKYTMSGKEVGPIPNDKLPLVANINPESGGLCLKRAT